MTYGDWNWRPLGELFRFGTGKTMSSRAREGDEKIPFLRTSNVLWDRIDLSVVDSMSIPPDELANKSLLPGDLLVCEGGSIGRAAIWEGQIALCSFQNHLHRLRPISDDVVPRFYVYFLQAAFTRLGIFEGAGNKTTIPNISRSSLAALNVPHPPLEEQRTIVEALAALRRAIDLQRYGESLAKELKRATMNLLFSRGVNAGPVKESALGMIPESWDVVGFASVRETLQYGTSTRCSTEEEGYPVLRIPNIESGKVNSADLKYAKLSPTEAERYLLEQGDLLFIRTNGVVERLGVCAVYAGDPQKSLFASYLIRARLNFNLINPLFAAYFFASEVGTGVIIGHATPAADGKYNLNTGAIDSLLIPLPDLGEQAQIVEILQIIDAKIRLHKEKYLRLHELFDNVLHKVMSGVIQAHDITTPILGDASPNRESAA